MGKKMSLRLKIVGMATMAMVVAAVSVGTAATPVRPPRPSGVSQSVLAACHYSTDHSQGFHFNGVFWGGFGYAGHYGGLTVVPSTTRVTSAGIEAQCLLARYGHYNPGPIDGIFGARSRAAMAQFQRDINDFGAGLTADGLPGPQSWKWLRWYEQ